MVTMNKETIYISLRMPVFIPVVMLFILGTGCASVRPFQPNAHMKEVIKILKKPDGKTILISAHRGDWRNAPENSIQGLRNCIKMGVDIVECDLKLTKDKHLIILHDNTLDRTTTGKGKPEDYSLAEIKQLKLRDGAGHSTHHLIPTLDEFLQEAKDKVVICIDKGFPYFEQAMATVRKMGMSQQIIYNIPALSADSLAAKNLMGMDDDLMLNVLGFPNDTVKAEKLLQSYLSRRHVIMHPTFASDTMPFVQWMKKVKNSGIHLWLNGLWPEHNGGHDDNRAVEAGQPEESWGWLISHGATIIQTDRPFDLLKYLNDKGLRPKTSREYK